jgi:FkbM family methyltransferase
MVMPILQGKLRGYRWVVGSSTHGCWLGSYEHAKRRLFEQIVKPGDVVYDVGANVGFYSLLASELVSTSGRVFAFEPVPRNIDLLKRHIQINKRENVCIIECVVGDSIGTARFVLGDDYSTGSIASSGSLLVQTLTLDSLVNQETILPPNVVKIDVEGAELEVLTGAQGILEHRRCSIFLSTHGQDIHQECCKRLQMFGYRLRPITDIPLANSDEILATPG